ncbi:MAG: DUF1488 family protein [Methylococcales bacterium]
MGAAHFFVRPGKRISYASPAHNSVTPHQRAGHGMQLTHHRTHTPCGTALTFPKLECWNTMTKVATVAANVGKKRILCRISLAILRDKFGASDEDPMRSVIEHRTAIQQAARTLIENERYEEDGSVLIRASDL